MNRFKNMVCVLEDDENAEFILERAVNVAQNNQSKLTVIKVIPEIKISGLDITVKTLQQHLTDSALNDIVEWTQVYDMDIAKTVLIGTSYLEIVRYVIRHDFDLVLKVAKKEEWHDQLFGSNDMHLFRNCPCPLWILKPDAPRQNKVILAAIDVEPEKDNHAGSVKSALNTDILNKAVAIALSEGAALHILNVWEVVGERALRHSFFLKEPESKVDEYVSEVKAQNEIQLSNFISGFKKQDNEESFDYLKPKVHSIKGIPKTIIPEYADKLNADLVVMGTVSRTGIPGVIIGNTAESILHKIGSSILAIKPASFRTPVCLKRN